jgi:hypothetical protein
LHNAATALYDVLGVLLPKQVEFVVSNNGKAFRTVATLTHNVPRGEWRRLMRTVAAENLDVAAR